MFFGYDQVALRAAVPVAMNAHLEKYAKKVLVSASACLFVLITNVGEMAAAAVVENADLTRYAAMVGVQQQDLNAVKASVQIQMGVSLLRSKVW